MTRRPSSDQLEYQGKIPNAPDENQRTTRTTTATATRTLTTSPMLIDEEGPKRDRAVVDNVDENNIG